MTLQELIETNAMICSIHIDVREWTEKSALLIQSYHIGPFEEEDKYANAEFGIEPRWITIRKPINYKDIGKDYWGVFTKNIPKKLLQLTVKSWDLWHGWSTNNGLDKHMMLVVHVAGNDEAVAIIEKEERKELDKKCQIEGQMLLEL